MKKINLKNILKKTFNKKSKKKTSKMIKKKVIKAKKIISKKTNHSCYDTGIHTDTCCSKHDNLKSNKVFHIKTTL